jgi:ketosteroid isomerase-like protein
MGRLESVKGRVGQVGRVSQVGIVLTILAIAAPAFAQTATSQAEKEIRAAERLWNEARVKADVAALDRLLADGWTVTHGGGTMDTKAQYLADLKSGDRKFSADVKEDELTVRIYGDTAVASGLSDSKVTFKGQVQGGPLRFTRVYVKRDGRWIMIVSHATSRRP